MKHKGKKNILPSDFLMKDKEKGVKSKILGPLDSGGEDETVIGPDIPHFPHVREVIWPELSSQPEREITRKIGKEDVERIGREFLFASSVFLGGRPKIETEFFQLTWQQAHKKILEGADSNPEQWDSQVLFEQYRKSISNKNDDVKSQIIVHASDYFPEDDSEPEKKLENTKPIFNVLIAMLAVLKEGFGNLLDNTQKYVEQFRVDNSLIPQIFSAIMETKKSETQEYRVYMNRFPAGEKIDGIEANKITFEYNKNKNDYFIILDEEKGVCIIEGKSVDISEHLQNALMHLVRYEGRVVLLEDLYEAAFGEKVKATELDEERLNKIKKYIAILHKETGGKLRKFLKHEPKGYRLSIRDKKMYILLERVTTVMAHEEQEEWMKPFKIDENERYKIYSHEYPEGKKISIEELEQITEDYERNKAEYLFFIYKTEEKYVNKGISTKFPPASYKALKCLIQNANSFVTYQLLFLKTDGTKLSNNDLTDNQRGQIHRAISDLHSATFHELKKYIICVPKVGYKFKLEEGLKFVLIATLKRK